MPAEILTRSAHRVRHLRGRGIAETHRRLRSEQSQTLGGNDTELRWTNLMLDYALGRSWYASFSFERSDDGPEANDQVYTTLSLRF